MTTTNTAAPIIASSEKIQALAASVM